MIVVDASTMVEILLQSDAGVEVEAELAASGGSLHAPHLIDVEITHALRRFAHAGEISAERGRDMLATFADIRVRRYPHGFLLSRAWELRSNVTAYDAVYVALAEVLDARLITHNRRLAAAAKDLIEVQLI